MVETAEDVVELSHEVMAGTVSNIRGKEVSTWLRHAHEVLCIP